MFNGMPDADVMSLMQGLLCCPGQNFNKMCAMQAQCPDALVYVLCGNPDITREIHMRSERKYPVTVGNIDCRVLKYKVLPPKQPQDTRAQMFVM